MNPNADTLPLWEAFAAEPTAENRNALVEHYYPDARKIAISLWRKKERIKANGADDWIAEATLVLVNAVENFDITLNTPFGHYLAVSIRRRYFNRRLAREVGFAEEFDAPDHHETPEFTADFWELAKRRVGADLIHLRFVEGLTWDEIGKRLGISHTAAYNKFCLFARKYQKHANA